MDLNEAEEILRGLNPDESLHYQATYFLQGHASRDAEVAELVEKAEIVVTHPAFTVGTASFEKLPRGLWARIKDLSGLLAKHRGKA